MKKAFFGAVVMALAIMSHLHGTDTGKSDQPDWVKGEQTTRPAGSR